MNETERAPKVDLQKAVRAAVNRGVARGDIPDEVVKKLIQRLTEVNDRFPIRWVDVCVYGICIDHFVEPGQLPSLLDFIVGSDSRFKKVELFPWGIPIDLVQVRVGLEDELAEFTSGGGRRHVFEGDPDGNPA